MSSISAFLLITQWILGYHQDAQMQRFQGFVSRMCWCGVGTACGTMMLAAEYTGCSPWIKPQSFVLTILQSITSNHYFRTFTKTTHSLLVPQMFHENIIRVRLDFPSRFAWLKEKTCITLQAPRIAFHQGQSHLPLEESGVLGEKPQLVSLLRELGQLTSLLEVKLLFP